MNLKSLALAVSILSLLIVGLGFPFFFSNQAKAQSEQDPSIIVHCVLQSGSCNFTSNSPPANKYVFVFIVDPSLNSGGTLYCPTGWTGIGNYVCYQYSSSAISVSYSCTGICALLEIDYIGTPFTMASAPYFCNSGSLIFVSTDPAPCSYPGFTPPIDSGVWFEFLAGSGIASNVICYDPYCAMWTVPNYVGYVPVLVADAGYQNNGWPANTKIWGNVSATFYQGGYWNGYELVFIAPATIGGSNNGFFQYTITQTATEVALVAPNPTQIQYWLIPMFLILGVGALVLLIGRYAGMTGGDTFMLFMIGAWIGSMFGAMANIVPLAMVIILSVIVIFLIWRKVS